MTKVSDLSESKLELFEHYRDKIRAVLAEMASTDLYFKEGTYDDIVALLADDVKEYPYGDALKLAGRKPFDPWEVPRNV